MYLKPDAAIPLKGKGSKLSAKQAAFVEEFMVDLNASKACLRAGYVTTSPNRIGTDLLRHPLVKREIEKHTEKRRERMELTADYVLTKLVSIVDNTETTNPQAAIRGLELLGKHLALFRERTEISGPDGEAIQYQKVQEDAASFTSAIARLTQRARTSGLDEESDTGTEG